MRVSAQQPGRIMWFYLNYANYENDVDCFFLLGHFLQKHGFTLQAEVVGLGVDMAFTEEI